MNKYERFLHSEFVKELEASPRLSELVCKLNGLVKVFVFGGWCRDKIHSCRYGGYILPADIDLVVDAPLDDDIFRKFARNHFNGFRLQLEEKGRMVDFWPLENTFAFTKGFFKPNIQNLLKSTIFDVNSVLYEIGDVKLINGIAIKAIESRQIGFNCTKYLNDFADLQAYRALAIAYRLNYSLREDVISFIADLFDHRSFDEFVTIVQKYRTHVSRDAIHTLYANFLLNKSKVRV